MNDAYTERLEGPDGQYIVLLTRLPYERAFQVEQWAVKPGSTLADFAHGCLHAMLWEAKVKDYLTDEDAGDDVDRGAPEVIGPWRERAVELYIEWKNAAFPAPKGSRRKAGSSSTSRARSETSASASS